MNTDSTALRHSAADIAAHEEIKQRMMQAAASSLMTDRRMTAVAQLDARRSEESTLLLRLGLAQHAMNALVVSIECKRARLERAPSHARLDAIERLLAELDSTMAQIDDIKHARRENMRAVMVLLEGQLAAARERAWDAAMNAGHCAALRMRGRLATRRRPAARRRARSRRRPGSRPRARSDTDDGEPPRALHLAAVVGASW